MYHGILNTDFKKYSRIKSYFVPGQGIKKSNWPKIFLYKLNLSVLGPIYLQFPLIIPTLIPT